MMDKTNNVDKSAHKGSSGFNTDDVTSRNKQKNRVKKRKRPSTSSEDEIILPDNTLETERILHASAVRNNIDDIGMRKILKKVVTNDHVLALVKLQEEEEGDSSSEDKSVQPKLTRAKAKELKKGSPRSAPWNLENLELTPINHIPVKTRPEVKALIAQELPEDEDDEEYKPTNDDVPSDDDHDHSCSDLDSQPRTPATPASQSGTSPRVLNDGPFKVPQDVSSARRKLIVDVGEPNIAERTRSKLSLSTTTIEHIESSFVPPDDVQPPVDNLWSQFLTGCLDPAAPHDEDDDADPEYNAAADADALDDDEDFLGSSLIKISKKELNDLVTELFNVMPATDEELTLENLANSVLTDTSQTEVPRWEGKIEPPSDDESTIRPSKRLKFEKGNNVTISGGKSEPGESRPVNNHVPCERIEPMNTRSLRAKEMQNAKAGKDIEKVLAQPATPKLPELVHICIEESNSVPGENDLDAVPPSLRRQIQPVTETVHIQLDSDVAFTRDQVLILQQQIRMHIQIATSNFLQLFVHPVHWQLGPVFKEYLETLEKLSQANENSIVNVCNLKPALNLVRDWEESVSKDTPENVEMVQFVNDQIERSRRRYAQNSLYVGEFHDKFKELVSTSPVFLYPYLLPAIPYKADNVKRVFYLLSEDELIVLGLDQFSNYMDDNKDMFKPVKNSRFRWSLSTVLQLVSKHMLPWITPKQLAAHITNVRTLRSSADKNNPIFNYFKYNKVNSVVHSILPYNPELTLYEQPEHEMPRAWARYLAKTSKRFKNFVKRRHHETGAKPTGVPIAAVTDTSIKKPLPHDFTKEIKCTRNPQDPMTDSDKPNDNTESENTQEKLNEIPINMYKMINTDKGTFLYPLEIVTINNNNGTVTKHTNTEAATTDTILTTSTMTVTTPAEVTSKKTQLPLKNKRKEHCSCCTLLRKMVKKQTVITDYFRKNKQKKKCYCSQVKNPKVTNKLRLLSNNFKNHSGLVIKELERRLKEIQSGKVRNEVKEFGNYTLNELVSVTTFQLKVVSRSLMSKFSYMKVRCKNLLSRFNPDKDDPIILATALFKTCEKEMLDLYFDFLEFLTPEQVDRLDKFKIYFIRNCAKVLMDKVDDEVQDPDARARILSQLKSALCPGSPSSCELCTSLLQTMRGYDSLAEYTFSLFPHRKETREPESNLKPAARVPLHSHVAQIQIIRKDEPSESEKTEENSKIDETQNAMVLEEGSSLQIRRDSLSGSEETARTTEDQPNNVDDDSTILMDIKIEPDTAIETEDNQKSIVETPKHPNTQAFVITLEDEIIKEEPSDSTEWTRAEDKLILEALQQLLTPEERKEKTVEEILEEKDVAGLISKNMSHKSDEEVRERVLYIMSYLVLSES